MINFPRKQIGPKMSDCLTCGVLPYGPDVDPQHKRDNTIYVRPSLNDLSEANGSSDLVGAPVGIFPISDSKRTTNPRDLTWEDFEKFEILTGTVQDMQAQTGSSRADGLVACDGTVEYGAKRGSLKSRMWLRSEAAANGSFLEKLKGRQVIAVTNLDASDSDERFEAGVAAILTLNGLTTVEPAKTCEDGYKLA